uniref:Orn/DAP/Arg decarboxylase 2 N-terminal domain-containing protein n=1 Tax=Monodon monoceros TaxID=40151 RepID=A0A8C6BK68_MONMO
MLELRLAKGLVGVSGMSTPVGNPKESEESPGSMWPKDLINLEAGETAWQVLKIRELSDLDRQDPFMVVDLGMLARRHQVFRQALPRVSPFYVVKCNSSPWVLHDLATLGTGFDCASQVELEQGLGLGVAPSRIIYYAACHGVRFLTFNSEGELIKVAQHHPGASTKFGASLEVCEHMLKSARDLGLAVVGTRAQDARHPIASRRPSPTAGACLRWAAGSGMTWVSWTSEGASLERRALTLKFEEGRGVEVIAEPGRFYAASVCMIAVNVIARKAVLEPGGWAGHYPGDLCPKLPLFSCTLYSPGCNAFDKLLLKEVQLPKLDVGDWLVFPSMGAYMSAMSSAFSGFPLPSHLLRHGT